jgi:hypothetical protein
MNQKQIKLLIELGTNKFRNATAYFLGLHAGCAYLTRLLGGTGADNVNLPVRGGEQQRSIYVTLTNKNTSTRTWFIHPN